VAVRTDWPKVLDRIELILVSYLTQRLQMVYVNEALAPRSELPLEVETAYNAVETPMGNATGSCGGASLVAVHHHR